jgi:hypothetical protein
MDESYYLRLSSLNTFGLPPIPRMSLADSFENGRHAGSGGGGSFRIGGTTPFFCRACGKTVSRKKVKPSCDVCSRCRSRGK